MYQKYHDYDSTSSSEFARTLQNKIKAIEKEIQELSATMEQIHTVKKYRSYYKEYKANPSDKRFFEKYKSQIKPYETALSELINPIPSSKIQRIF